MAAKYKKCASCLMVFLLAFASCATYQDVPLVVYSVVPAPSAATVAKSPAPVIVKTIPTTTTTVVPAAPVMSTSPALAAAPVIPAAPVSVPPPIPEVPAAPQISFAAERDQAIARASGARARNADILAPDRFARAETALAEAESAVRANDPLAAIQSYRLASLLYESARGKAGVETLRTNSITWQAPEYAPYPFGQAEMLRSGEEKTAAAGTEDAIRSGNLLLAESARFYAEAQQKGIERLASATRETALETQAEANGTLGFPAAGDSRAKGNILMVEAERLYARGKHAESITMFGSALASFRDAITHAHAADEELRLPKNIIPATMPRQESPPASPMPSPAPAAPKAIIVPVQDTPGSPDQTAPVQAPVQAPVPPQVPSPVPAITLADLELAFTQAGLTLARADERGVAGILPLHYAAIQTAHAAAETELKRLGSPDAFDAARAERLLQEIGQLRNNLNLLLADGLFVLGKVDEIPDSRITAATVSRLIAEAKTRQSWALLHNAVNNYPDRIRAGSALIEDAALALGKANYRGAMSAVAAALRTMAAIEEFAPLPAYYRVRPYARTGDCFTHIAAYDFVYADKDRWTALYNENRSLLKDPGNPANLSPGLVLRIPSIAGEFRTGTWDSRKTYAKFGK